MWDLSLQKLELGGFKGFIYRVFLFLLYKFSPLSSSAGVEHADGGSEMK